MLPVIALLFGGQSEEHAISLRSAEAVWQALKELGRDVVLIGVTKDGRWHLCDQVGWTGNEPELFLKPYPNARGERFWRLDGKPGPAVDVFFPVLHGRFVEDGCLQGLLELAKVPYVGAKVLGAAIGMDKEVSKRLVAAAGIPVVPSLSVREKLDLKHEEYIQNILGWPVFVKPAGSGSSFGVSRVTEPGQLSQAFKSARAFGSKVLIEAAIDAREMEIALLEVAGAWRSSEVVEIVPKNTFYSFEAKYEDPAGAEFKYPGLISTPIREKLRDFAVKVGETLELSGLVRVDFFLDRKTDALFFNEVNTMPGFTSISMFPKLWSYEGISYPQLVETLIKECQ